VQLQVSDAIRAEFASTRVATLHVPINYQERKGHQLKGYKASGAGRVPS
jgi:hypothetical protein